MYKLQDNLTAAALEAYFIHVVLYNTYRVFSLFYKVVNISA